MTWITIEETEENEKSPHKNGQDSWKLILEVTANFTAAENIFKRLGFH